MTCPYSRSRFRWLRQFCSRFCFFAGRVYFKPTDQGFEQRLRQRLDEIRKLKSRTVPGT
jgi:hypothetical protein